jgi:GNAT superfamily N-acetyltransferase
MSYEITRYRPDLRSGAIGLQKHLVSPDPVLNDAYFNWKHEQNPYAREPIAYLALSNGEVAGMRAFLGARWRLGESGRTASWLCACDFVVDPVHRGQKLFRRIMNFALADLAEQGFGPTLNWSASPITYGASLRSGWRLVAPYASWAHETSRARHAWRLAQRLRHWPLVWRFADLPASLALRPGFDALDAAWSRSGQTATMTFAREPRPEAMARLVDRISTRPIQHVRDAAYYRWRFANPLCDYRFVFWSAAGLEGFLVLQLARNGEAADISIVDWEASRPDLLEAMLSRVVAIGGYDRLSIWSATLPIHVTASLQRLGFMPVDDTRGDPAYRRGLLALGPGGSDIRETGPENAEIFSSFDSWDLRMLYSDFY